MRPCLLKLQMTESQESLEVYWRTGLVFNLDQPKKWVEEITIHSGEGKCKLSHSRRMNKRRGWCKVLQKISRVQGMSNQRGDKNVVLPQQFKQAQHRPRARHREGREVQFNWAARCLKFLWKYTVFTQTITLGRKKRTMWWCAKEMPKTMSKNAVAGDVKNEETFYLSTEITLIFIPHNFFR